MNPQAATDRADQTMAPARRRAGRVGVAVLTVVHLVAAQVPHMGFEIDDNHDHWPEPLATLARRL
jgi:hypothetical protein